VVIFGYNQTGMVKPVRGLETPHQSWGISISRPRDEVALSVQQMNAVVFYRRGAAGMEPPLRTLRGYDTGLADPHGIVYDEERQELVVANHGNWTELRPYSPYDPLAKTQGEYKPGRFEPPSIRTFPAAAAANTKPLRSISGDNTGLNWPMGADVDAARDEIIIANYGDSSVRFFRRTAEGNVAPSRIIKGDRTGLVGPVDVGVDTVGNEIWVANYSDHTALVFDRDAKGNVAPKRIVRNGPQGAPALTFTNAAAAAYDTRRDALIVPNCVSIPKVSVFARTATGLTAPERVIEGQGTSLSRTMHGVAYDEPHDEISIPVALGGAILVFRGGAKGDEAPIRVIQGSKTGLIRPQTVAVDPVHDEIIVGDTTARAVFVFDRQANGDVAPKRALYGEMTRLLDVVGVAVDPVRSVIVVASRSLTTVGLLTFDRLAAGNVRPRTVIAGRNTGLAHFRQVAVDSGSGRIFIAQQSMREKQLEPYKEDKPRSEEEFKRAAKAASGRVGPGYIGVWDIDDDGDVAPRVLIQGAMSRLIAPGGIALDPKRGELYAIDGGSSGYYAYIVPQLFREPWSTLAPGTH
jgi:DNA-binding beta-propeller fold protein YncE